MAEETVNERIKFLLETRTGGNKSKFAKMAGVTGQTIADLIEVRKGNPSFAVIQGILTAFPDINSNWLIMGESPMLKGQQPEGTGLTSGEATVTESETLLKLAVTEAKLEAAEKQLADKEKLLDRLWSMIPAKLGKLMSRLEAAYDGQHGLALPVGS